MTVSLFRETNSRGMQLRTCRACIRLGVFWRGAPMPTLCFFGKEPHWRKTRWVGRVWRFALAVGCAEETP